jgi:hypothetical protein
LRTVLAANFAIVGAGRVDLPQFAIFHAQAQLVCGGCEARERKILFLQNFYG